MPSIASHFVVAELVFKMINKNGRKIDKGEFYRGNILPDIIKGGDSHYNMKGKYYLIPDTQRYMRNNNMNMDINKGYLCHLLLDKYFLDEYVIENVCDYNKIQLFSPEFVYSDYTNMNVLLVKKYKLDVEFINVLMKNYEVELDIDKYQRNVRFINTTIPGKLRFIDFDKFCSFLEDVAKRIYNTIF